MAHFAKLDDNNVVLGVHVLNNAAIDPQNEEETGIALLKELHGWEKWAQTSYNNNFRVRYACAGDTFNPDLGDNGAFIRKKPYPSWVFNETTLDWEAPIPRPAVTELQEAWAWDETTQSWFDQAAEA